jgi:outer membrane biogenesis lipoprotein LolB
LRIDNFELNNEGQLSELKQSGWHITYNRYAEIDEYTLPGRIQLDNGNLRIRIVTQTWGL